MTTQNTDRFTVEAGDSVRVKQGAGAQWAGRRGVAVRIVGGSTTELWEVSFDSGIGDDCGGEARFTADFSERELTVMEKGVAK